MYPTQRRSPARGFTLIELMVVMVIIAILASLISVAVIKVMDNAKTTRVKAEIDVMHQKILEAYKVGGSNVYPPNFQDATALNRFWARQFPYAQEQPPAGLTSAQALVFWLGGFSPDLRHPLTGQGTRIVPYQFVPSRLHDPSNPTDYITPADPTKNQTGQFVNSAGQPVYPVYWPDHPDMSQPYVYFDLSRPGSPSYKNSTSGNTLTPYKSDKGGGNMNAQSFQIICAGVDNDHGVGGSYPAGITGGDLDNITNFAGGQLIDDRP